MRRLLVILTALAMAIALARCGGKFRLPTENRANRLIPSDKSYQMVATWSGMTDVIDILLTQGSGTQLFVLFNHGGSGTGPRGEIRSFTRLKPTGTPDPLPGVDFRELFNPVALCSGGNGQGSGNSRIYVLDRGDSCLARSNPSTGSCDTTGNWNQHVAYLDRYWRVREFGLLGGDTLSTFTDTTVAHVNGIAADANGNVYVSCIAIILLPNQFDPRQTERTFQFRVFRYARGGGDVNMPGTAWHRDPAWSVDEGSGVGTVIDPRGMFWSPVDGGALYAADFGKNWVQKINDQLPNTGDYEVDGADTGTPFSGPVDVTVDLAGYVYLSDNGNQRVLRYSPGGAYIQQVNVDLDAFGQPLSNPVAVAADDSLVFVGDAARNEVIRYRRRP